MNLMDDRGDYAASMGGGRRDDITPNKTFAPAKPYDFSNPADQLRGGLLQPRDMNREILEEWAKNKVSGPSPIKVFTVMVDPENGKYMAFLGSDPSKKATAHNRDQAIVDLLTEQKLIVAVEND